MAPRNSCRHTEDCQIGMATHGACPACLENENRDLRDAIRLIIGRHTNQPWRNVPETDVDDYLKTIRKLKSQT